MELQEVKGLPFKGRNRRLLSEWEILHEWVSRREDIALEVVRCNEAGLAVEYEVCYSIRCICGVDHERRPLYAERFLMRVVVPDDYPCVDAPVELRFMTHDNEGQEIPHPWHPNIKYFGAFAGRVCLNRMDSYTEIAWCVERVAKYLRYERYHAANHPPYPEDLTVAKWVEEYGEVNGYIGGAEVPAQK